MSSADIREKIIRSLFSERDSDGVVKESYITHTRIYEDSASPSAPPEYHEQSSSTMKERYILLSVKRNGRVRVHKSRANDNGTFQIGKTWNLDELVKVEDVDRRGIIITLQKSYYWSMDASKEKFLFVNALIKVYKKYTGGRCFELVGFKSSTSSASSTPLSPSTESLTVSARRSSERLASSSPASPKQGLQPLETQRSNSSSQSASNTAPALPSSRGDNHFSSRKIPDRVVSASSAFRNDIVPNTSYHPSSTSVAQRPSNTHNPALGRSATNRAASSPIYAAPLSVNTEPARMKNSQTIATLPSVPPLSPGGASPLIPRKSSDRNPSSPLLTSPPFSDAQSASNTKNGYFSLGTPSSPLDQSPKLPRKASERAPLVQAASISNNNSNNHIVNNHSTTSVESQNRPMRKLAISSATIVPEGKSPVIPKKASDRLASPKPVVPRLASPAEFEAQTNHRDDTQKQDEESDVFKYISSTLASFTFADAPDSSTFTDKIRDDIDAIAKTGLEQMIREDDRVNDLMNKLDLSIAQCEEVESMLTLYEFELASLQPDIQLIEAQSRALHVQKANQQSLISEISSSLSN